MENKNNVTIYAFINTLWKFIKHTEIPAQNDDDAWDKVVADATDLTREYKTSDPLHVLFRMWTVAYLDYMNSISKGVPTLMQEANEMKEQVI